MKHGNHISTARTNSPLRFLVELPTSKWQRTPTCVLVALLVSLAASPSHSQAPQKDTVATRKYSVALGFQKKKLFDQAAQRWQQFIKEYPQNKRVPTAYHHLGVCQIQSQQFVEAAAAFRTLLSKFPQFPARDSAQFNLGMALYNAALASAKPADFNAAAAGFATVTSTYGKSPLVDQSLYYQAECLCLAEKQTDAIPVYEKLIAQFPKSGLLNQAHYSLAATLQDLKKEEPAATVLATFLTKFPKDPLIPDVQLRLGLSLFNQGKFAESEPLFVQAASSQDYPHADYALMHQGQALFEQDKVAEAATVYESVKQRFPKSTLLSATQLAAGKCRYRLEQFPQAQQQFAATLATQSDDAPEAAHWLGRTLLRLKKPTEAITILDQAIETYPKSAFIPNCKYARIDAIAMIPDRQPEAATLYAQFSEQHPEHEKAPESLYQAAFISLQLTDVPAAQKYCDAFLANPMNLKHAIAPHLLLTAADAYLQGKTPAPQKSEGFYRQVVSQFPKHERVPRAQLGIGICLRAQQQWDAAIKQLTTSEAVFQQPELLAESRFLIGQSHLDAKRPPEAVVALRSAIAAKPDWEHVDEIRFVLGVSLRADQKLDAAITELNQFNTLHLKSTYRDQALLQVAEIQSLQKKHDLAIATYGKLIAEIPMSTRLAAALYGVGSGQFELGQVPAALKTLDQLVTMHPQADVIPRGRYLRGLCRLNTQQYAPAIEDLQAFLNSKPDPEPRADAQFAIARSQMALKQVQPAIQTMNTVLQQVPDYPRADDVYYELGFAYLELKDNKQAVVAFTALANKLPDSPRAAESAYRVGELEEQANRFPAAAAAFQLGLQRSGEVAVREKLFYRLGNLQYRQKQYNEAVATFEKQLAEIPTGDLSFAAIYVSGESRFAQKQFRQALDTYSRIVESKAETAREFQARALYRGGVCASQLSDWPLSEQRFAALVQQFPKFQQLGEARYGLGVAMQNQKKLDQAKGVFQQITVDLPDTETAAKSWFMMGQCCFAQKQFTEAIDCFSEVAFGFKHPEWQPLSYFEAGRCYVQLKNVTAARKMLTAVVEEFPKHARVKDAQAILKQLK
ncbi:MAG: tetratricopeptide repeat protein [Planctomycetota bacterium]|nr:tetratricopeptide repeat protein [Planctomycetota bacterium]